MAGYISVDRIENGICACEMEGRVMKMIPLSLLPEGVREGDVLVERNGVYSLDREETRSRREKNRRLMELLREASDEDSRE